ncbi:hypothetical protein SLS53_002230 [Cytospora paraplurivora]|uniref:Uncharacterized protein n=1 Tax=Cytospora paraplurivora TaxID=2898453 RepID=A0AAN9YJB6_9PEZI
MRSCGHIHLGNLHVHFGFRDYNNVDNFQRRDDVDCSSERHLGKLHGECGYHDSNELYGIEL